MPRPTRKTRTPDVSSTAKFSTAETTPWSTPSTNTRTRAVKTYIVSQDGTYRFPALSSAVDYEVYAQYNGHKSDTKSVSQFDDRSEVYIDLRIGSR